MSNDLIVFDDEKIALIKEMFCKNATKAEFELFIHMAQRLQLDPTTRQIYFIKFGSQMSIVVGIDGYRAIAERSRTYMPGREPTFNYDKSGNLVSCTAYAKKWSDMDKQWHEIAATAFLNEYDTGKNQWAKGKHYMLAKTAEALMLRKGWPSSLSGTNTDDEMEKVILDVETTRTPYQQAVKDLVEGQIRSSAISGKIEDQRKISAEDAGKILTLIADDLEYKARILNFYKVSSFTDVPHSELNTILERVEVHNQERLKAELEAK